MERSRGRFLLYRFKCFLHKLRLKFKKDLHLPIQSRLKFGKQITVSLNMLGFLGGKIEIHAKYSFIAKIFVAEESNWGRFLWIFTIFF